MRSINPKCIDKNSFKYSILISLHYYELKHHPERINQFKPYINKCIFSINDDPNLFESNNPSISLTIYDEYAETLYKSTNKSNKQAYIVKINNHRYHTSKPHKRKYIQLRELLKQFTQRELKEYVLSKIIH